MDREEEMALLRKQMEEMQRALSHPEVQQLLHTLDKGKEKKGLESGEIPQDSARKEPQIVEQSQREAQVGPSQKRDKQNEDNQRPESPQFSFMKDLDNIVPEQDMNLEPEREEAKNGEVQSKRRIPVDDKSKHIHKKKHQKKKTFKAGEKDVKFEAYNGRRNNDKALAFIRQFEVAFAEGNFKERSKLRHVGMYLKGTASSWWLTQILEGKKPKDWSAFKKAFYSQFLPPDFEQEANALKEALLAKNVSAKVYIGMRYWHPFTEEALEQLKRDQITRLVILPLYPQFSISTSGSSLRVLEEIFRKDQYFANLQHTVIPSWYQREGYVQAMADLVGKELKTFKKTNEVVVFFSAHGVPRTYVEEAGDPYKEEMEECVRLVMAELKKRGVNNKYVLAYQSRVGPVEWLKPYTDDTIKELGKMGVKGLLTVPISFVSEHIETLEEIDMEYRELAYVSGIEEWAVCLHLDAKALS
ncbi:hypothetical protein L7F22_058792 [Adiantum nelumboides]|nr:hypothetical protein [Adiantum nelumboides]